MNLMINNYCNLKCSYCFAQETMCSQKAVNISMSNFCTYLDFLVKSNMKGVRLIGGEPTLHPQLEQLIDKVIEYGCFTSILIFSNFTFSDEICDMIIRKNKTIHITFLPNINTFDFLLPKQKEQILKNLDKMYKNIGMNNLGVNVYDPNMDFTQWEDLILKYKIKHLRYSIVLPTTDVSDDFNFYEFFHSFQDALLRLVDISVKCKVEIGCDCNGLPICCYDDDAVVRMLKVCPEIFGEQYCESPTIDIKPDLSISGCFVCGKYLHNQYTLADFNNYNEITDTYKKERENSISGMPRKECYECDRYKRTGQGCSCWSYRKY